MSAFKLPTMDDRAVSTSRGARASKAHHDALDLDLRLDMALGRPEDLSAYADCIRGARYEAMARKVMP